MAEAALEIDGWPERDAELDLPPIPAFSVRRLSFSKDGYMYDVEVHPLTKTMRVERYTDGGKWCGFVPEAPVDPSLSDDDIRGEAVEAVHAYYMAVAAALFPRD